LTCGDRPPGLSPGAPGAGAHATEEFADIESVVQLARILAESALHYCGRA